MEQSSYDPVGRQIQTVNQLDIGAVTPKLKEWLQQFPRITSEISVQKSEVLRYCAGPLSSLGT